jgi:hypothetical protein
MADMGYHITYFDLDTEDTVFAGNTIVPESHFTGNFSTSENRHLVISHDIVPETASTLTEHMLKAIQAAGLQAVTVGDCLGEPPENWYRYANGERYVPPSSWTRYAKPAQPPSPAPPSPSPSSGSESSRVTPSNDSDKPQVSAPSGSSSVPLPPSASEKGAAPSSSASVSTFLNVHGTYSTSTRLTSKIVFKSDSQVKPSTPAATNTAKSSTVALTVPWMGLFTTLLVLAGLYAV